MILRAISSLMATRDSFTLTMMLPPRADTTVMDPPAVNPKSSRCYFTSGFPLTLRIMYSSPIFASASGIITIPPNLLVKLN